ncbi:MAG: (2Fe-2S) ferredoxin domain-containing protein [Polyangiaceae bacterium]|nr:(2Fe-2S) ferredoxin domain-containing protein [Polyangiaceae bacterium]
MAKRKRYLFVCVNERPVGSPKGSCATRGAVEIHAALKAEIAMRKLAVTEVRACTSSCHDVCWAGPSILVSPDNVVYGRVTLDDVPEIVDALAEGRFVERLVLPPEDFEQSTARPGLPEHAPAKAPAAGSGAKP